MKKTLLILTVLTLLFGSYETATSKHNRYYKKNHRNYTKIYNRNNYSRNNSYPPEIAENGDRRNYDNDGDGRIETIYVKGYYKSNGTYVRSHYRAAPRRR
jgi:hypothetical protein